jgi:ABC-type proline/glycine betaine transport system permease subunit
VQVPLARKTIIVGLNQTILAALSMAIIASYVNGPGLGKPVLQALTQNDFGRGLVPGLLIVVMGIMLDRSTARPLRPVSALSAWLAAVVAIRSVVALPWVRGSLLWQLQSGIRPMT